MQTWALANQKGGTGKTTTAINLSAALAAQGKRCLLVDLDPQAHATQGLGVAVEGGRSSAAIFLEAAAIADLVRSVPGGFHLVPAESRLVEFEEAAERLLASERILAAALERVRARYDWVVLDCPPRADGVLTANAVRAADVTCLVVETGAFALQGALQARRIFEARARDLGCRPSLRVLATLYEPREELDRECLIAMQARFEGVLLETVVRRHGILRTACAASLPARELAPDSLAARDFDALAREVLRLTRAPAATVPAPRTIPSDEEARPWMPSRSSATYTPTVPPPSSA
jgi:chromosome partitioning protein